MISHNSTDICYNIHSDNKTWYISYMKQMFEGHKFILLLSVTCATMSASAYLLLMFEEQSLDAPLWYPTDYETTKELRPLVLSLLESLTTTKTMTKTMKKNNYMLYIISVKKTVCCYISRFYWDLVILVLKNNWFV